MDLKSLKSISPIDGRYSKKTKKLQDFFSEYALMKYRVKVEVDYFIELCKIPLPQLSNFPENKFGEIKLIHRNFCEISAKRIKEIENVTNHDVKAIEYFIKEEFEKINLGKFKEFIHFGLTSQDINNTAVPLSIKDAYNKVIFPEINFIMEKLKKLSIEWADVTMLARTHGQPASPTKLGKEILVFLERIENQMTLINRIPFSAKFSGATGNFNAHHIAYPNIDWKSFSDSFVEKKIGLKRLQNTTQIEHYDNLSAFMDGIKRINNILIDLCRDIWAYISIDYFKQKIKKGEIGSSAMPHKVNPIDFENAEGNLGVSNALLQFLSNKLPISRLQRDLTDSTVLRNIGVPLSHNLIAFSSILKGLDKIILNEEKIKNDLDNNWAVCAEAIQTILRREGYPEAYEILKSLTRNTNKIDSKTISKFINKLNINENIKEEMRKISPHNYTGI